MHPESFVQHNHQLSLAINLCILICQESYLELITNIISIGQEKFISAMKKKVEDHITRQHWIAVSREEMRQAGHNKQPNMVFQLVKELFWHFHKVQDLPMHSWRAVQEEESLLHYAAS